jgi:hypothetical protein
MHLAYLGAGYHVSSSWSCSYIKKPKMVVKFTGYQHMQWHHK